MNISTYRQTLLNQGHNISEIRKNQSDNIINQTFTGDPTYKRCYILTNNGWEWVDAKYQKHTTPSILKDEVDYYLQFRPKVHFKVGTYVYVPDDTSVDLDLPEDPFDVDIFDRKNLWMIVGRTDANAFVRYSILKCNYEFRWLHHGKVCCVIGCIRNANSYTSGVWRDEKSQSLDNLTGFWIPDIYDVYPNYENLGLDDTRTIDYEQRFFITNNILHPKVYQVTKVVELVPRGIIKLSIKQDEYYPKRDNLSQMICDYYTDTGSSIKEKPTESKLAEITSAIYWMYLNNNNELDYLPDSAEKVLKPKTISYFKAKFSDDYVGQLNWTIEVNDTNLSDEEKSVLINYLNIKDYEDGAISITPARVKRLIGKSFILSVSDENGYHTASIVMGVIE